MAPDRCSGEIVDWIPCASRLWRLKALSDSLIQETCSKGAILSLHLLKASAMPMESTFPAAPVMVKTGLVTTSTGTYKHSEVL